MRGPTGVPDIHMTLLYRLLNSKTSIKFVNTSMHGVSDAAMTKAFGIFGLSRYIPVVAQQKPDPEFPTVKFPNPEEKGMSVQLYSIQSHILNQQ